jgi:ribosome-associated heat shock protein Hsp15
MSDVRTPGMRLDKWLWVARWFKTRALAAEAAAAGRVQVGGISAKPARELRPGDIIELRLPGAPPRTLRVLALSAQRGPAAAAQALYQETVESLARREQALQARRLAPEPAATLTQGRPTKRDRRQLEQAARPAWQRWSASIDDD